MSPDCAPDTSTPAAGLPTVPTTGEPWLGLTPRRWQAEALRPVLNSIRRKERGVVAAVMGSGKSILQAEVCAAGQGRVVVTVPTVRLVDQLASTIETRCPGEVGRYYTHAHEADRRITVCCLPSLPALLADTDWPGPPALWIADEAHKTECSTVLDAYAALSPERAIAFTATPFRADENEELSLWDSLVYEYSAQDAIADGVVVPWRPVFWLGSEISGQDGLDGACTIMIRDALSVGPGLVNAGSIDDAETYAAALRADGIAAEAVHSRRSRAAVTDTMERLRTGELAAVVHVSMLSEGVDYPWLRWLCLRRPVTSRVRFCQEVGRVLRACEGKTEALLLDPTDLLSAHGLSYAEVLAGQGNPGSTEPLDEHLEPCVCDCDVCMCGACNCHCSRCDHPRSGTCSCECHGEGGRKAGRERFAVRMAQWRRYLRLLWTAAATAGLVELKIKSRGWRPMIATEKQIATVERAARGLSRDTTIPPPHRRQLAAIADHADELRRGEVSDLLGVLFVLRDSRLGRGCPSGAWDLMRAAVAQESSDD